MFVPAVAAAALLSVVVMNKVAVVQKEVKACLGGWLELKCRVKVLVVVVVHLKVSTKT